MDDNLYQDDFEEFLQDQVRNQRMYPSDAVWRNINKELHGENRWPALTISAFALLIATVAVCVHFAPKPNIFAIPSSNTQINAASGNNQIANLSAPSFLNSGNTKVSTVNKITVGTNLNSITRDKIASANIASVKALNNLAYSRKEQSKYLVSSTDNRTSGILAKIISIDQKIANSNPALVEELKADAGVTSSVAQSAGATISTTPLVTRNIPDYNDKNMVDDFLKEQNKDLLLYTTTQLKVIKNRFNYVVYIAPSVSYRKLTEDRSGSKENTGAGGPVALNYVTDVNKVVRHKPGTGIEAGLGIIYNLTNKLRIRSGLQFNLRQYNIEAYRSSAEQASIALVTANRIDTINTFSVYRTNNGYVSAELVNRYYQIAIPVGLEWEIIGNKNIQLNVAGSIQPTYLLNKNAYLLSTNYKNYTESRGMINNWNLNSNVEAFLSFKVGNFKWQLGPQLRYQHFSTFIAPYPIKEHLMDYGFKLGVSKIIL